jgi:hypothetical protein
MCVKVESTLLGRSQGKYQKKDLRNVFRVLILKAGRKRKEGWRLVVFLVVKNLPITKAARPKTPRLLSTRR